MSLFNRMGNSKNRFQTDAKRVLCLCSAGLLRSPTMANVLHQEFGYNTRAAGVVDEFALVVLDEVLVEWADEIVCAEESHKVALLRSFQYNIDKNVDVLVLNIPDLFEWNDKDLRERILKSYKIVRSLE